jgi:hypothetical protein
MSAVPIYHTPVVEKINPISSTGGPEPVVSLSNGFSHMKIFPVTGTAAPVMPAPLAIAPPLTYTGCPVCGHDPA